MANNSCEKSAEVVVGRETNLPLKAKGKQDVSRRTEGLNFKK
jgi:hypothetical protein